jgi:hypothetical protein
MNGHIAVVTKITNDEAKFLFYLISVNKTHFSLCQMLL